jgi:hypothetical protein
MLHQMTSTASWPELLDGARPKQHILQLYLCRDEAFFGRAVALFAASGLKKQEGVILAATKAHRALLSPLLESHGIDIPAAEARGQLTIVDAETTLPRFMVNGMPDAADFKRIAAEVIGRVRRSGYSRVRWWGEIVNLLWEEGNVQAFIRLEELFDEVGRSHEIAIFCSMVLDPFDIEAHDVALPGALKTHSHLIPLEDYRKLEESVNRALIEVVGREKGEALRVLMSRSQNPHAHVPPPQAALLWLKRLVEQQAPEILGRARTYYYAPLR